jgi:two-component system, chemotaxis family, protein-glutamate methylesterase/glutaminase
MGDLSERTLRILAADDSAVMRGIMRNLFAGHAEDRSSELPRMELCGVARDGVECLEAVKELRPDVLVLDLEMPRLNGLDVLERLRRESPGLPVIMCSSHTEHGARATLEALARGASDYVMKPSAQRNFAEALQSLSMQLLPKIAALAKGATRRGQETGKRTERSLSASPVEARSRSSASIEVIVIGLSTGGPSALEHLLPKLPKDFAVPILIVQHMPKLFTGALAERLDSCCALHVEEAYDGAVIRPGMVWLAPGDAHMEVASRLAVLGETDGAEGVRRSRVRLHYQEPLNHCRPSVDYLFHSAARMYGAGTLALMMTGMGSDGLEGARVIHQRGGMVLAQDEATSAVWGMPGRVSEAGIASATLPLWALAGELEQRVSADRAMRPEPGLHASDALSARREVMHGLY